MRNLILSGAIVFSLSLFAFGDKPYREPNYDESKIPPYTLEAEAQGGDTWHIRPGDVWPASAEA